MKHSFKPQSNTPTDWSATTSQPLVMREKCVFLLANCSWRLVAALEMGQWLPGNHQLLGRSAYFLHSWQEVARDCKKCHVRMVAPKTSWRLVCKHSETSFKGVELKSATQIVKAITKTCSALFAQQLISPGNSLQPLSRHSGSTQLLIVIGPCS